MEKDLLLVAMDAKFQALGLETELEPREEYSERRSTEENSEEMIEPEEFAPEDLDRNSQKDDDPENCLDQKIAESEEDWRRKGEEEEEESKLVKGEEIVFVLDLLALSASAFGLAMKAMLTSPHILKLGFAFKQDLLHLTTTFPGSEAHGCFDKVIK
jgi:DNA-nicking Smr family endonuclease